MEADPLGQLRARVAEQGMSAAELDAAIADALAQVTELAAPHALKAMPCQCPRPLLPEGTCTRCGRWPPGDHSRG